MKKILVTRKLLQSNEDRIKEIYDANLNINDELYTQKKLIDLSQGCDGILSSLTDIVTTIGRLLLSGSSKNPSIYVLAL